MGVIFDRGKMHFTFTPSFEYSLIIVSYRRFSLFSVYCEVLKVLRGPVRDRVLPAARLREKTKDLLFLLFSGDFHLSFCTVNWFIM